MDYPVITIVGAGFGGAYTARWLIKKGFRVCLIAPEDRFTFMPLLHEVATGTLCEDDVAFSLETFLPLNSFDFVSGYVEKINFEEKFISLANGRKLNYEKLVIATGSRPKLEFIKGSEYALSIKTITDAIVIRNRLFSLISSNQQEIAVNVIGGGLTGVELICEIENLLKYRSKNKKIILRLFDRNLLPLAETDPKLSSYIDETLRRLNVEVHLNCKVTSILPDCVFLSEKVFPADLNIIAAGVALNTDFVDSNYLDERKNIIVEESLLVTGQQDVFALGDIITIKGKAKPEMLAQLATRQSSIVARNILNQILKKPLIFYQAKVLGILVSLGAWRAVGRIMGIGIYGPLAWYFWRTVYLFKTPGISNRLSIAWRWTVYLFDKRRHVPRG